MAQPMMRMTLTLFVTSAHGYSTIDPKTKPSSMMTLALMLTMSPASIAIPISSEVGSLAVSSDCPSEAMTAEKDYVCLATPQSSISGVPVHGEEPCTCDAGYECMDGEGDSKCTSGSYYCHCKPIMCKPSSPLQTHYCHDSEDLSLKCSCPSGLSCMQSCSDRWCTDGDAYWQGGTHGVCRYDKTARYSTCECKPAPPPLPPSPPWPPQPPDPFPDCEWPECYLPPGPPAVPITADLVTEQFKKVASCDSFNDKCGGVLVHSYDKDSMTARKRDKPREPDKAVTDEANCGIDADFAFCPGSSGSMYVLQGISWTLLRKDIIPPQGKIFFGGRLSGVGYLAMPSRVRTICMFPEDGHTDFRYLCGCDSSGIKFPRDAMWNDGLPSTCPPLPWAKQLESKPNGKDKVKLEYAYTMEEYERLKRESKYPGYLYPPPIDPQSVEGVTLFFEMASQHDNPEWDANEIRSLPWYHQTLEKSPVQAVFFVGEHTDWEGNKHSACSQWQSIKDSTGVSLPFMMANETAIRNFLECEVDGCKPFIDVPVSECPK